MAEGLGPRLIRPLLFHRLLGLRRKRAVLRGACRVHCWPRLGVEKDSALLKHFGIPRTVPVVIEVLPSLYGCPVVRNVGHGPTVHLAAMMCSGTTGALRHRAPQPSPFPLRDSSPHSRALRVGQGEAEALLAHLAPAADRFGLACCVGTERREEQGWILAPACGPLHPCWPA